MALSNTIFAFKNPFDCNSEQESLPPENNKNNTDYL